MFILNLIFLSLLSVAEVEDGLSCSDEADKVCCAQAADQASETVALLYPDVVNIQEHPQAQSALHDLFESNLNSCTNARMADRQTNFGRDAIDAANLFLDSTVSACISRMRSEAQLEPSLETMTWNEIDLTEEERSYWLAKSEYNLSFLLIEGGDMVVGSARMSVSILYELHEREVICSYEINNP